MGALRQIIPQISAFRVVPEVPIGRIVVPLAKDSSQPSSDTTPDETSALSFFLHYDGGSLEGGRRVSLRRIEAQGTALLSFLAHCHERQAIRRFRADRVVEAVDMATGEVLDCQQFHEFIMARSGGLIETRLMAMAKLLVFMGRCDGRMAPDEWDSLDRSVVRLYRSLLDDDQGADLLVEEARRLAPDARDFLKCLRGLAKTRLPAHTHKELTRAIGAMIDADGQLHPEEVSWAIEAGDFIARMPTCD